MPQLQVIVEFFRGLQDEICRGLESLDGGERFQEDLWVRENGGGGRTRVIEEGSVFEKGGVNFSHVFGEMPAKISAKLGLSEKIKFDACGVSIVIHPANPHVPIIHMNVRYFEMEDGQYWFGGGIDLTPVYIIKEDAAFFHRSLKKACDVHNAAYYPEFKAWCDRYFYLNHRKETRGVGGLFFDRLSGDEDKSKTEIFNFVKEVGNAFLPVYSELVQKNVEMEWTDQQKEFQLLRRSRYVEFNLLYDKGTKFGLETDGRTESILMSMPPLAKWIYDYHPEPESQEAFTLANLKPTDWLSF